MTPPFPRSALPTPALVLDRAALDRNIAAMARWAAERQVRLRPHAKTHKSADIAHRQIAAGAVGICCAKLGEAEALAEQGVEDILITSPVVPVQTVARLAALAQRIRLAVVVDHPDNLDRIAAAGATLDVLIDIDPGMHRTGVASAEAAVALAQRVTAVDTLRYRGVQFYCGSLQHIASATDRLNAVTEKTRYLQQVLDRLGDAGLTPEVITGGGTGSFPIDADLGVLTELQVGSYIFMDREYRDCELAGPSFESALFLDTRVVSTNTPGQVTVDAGLKAMATEAGPPAVHAGAHPGSAWRFLGDEHGCLITPAGQPDPILDQLVALIPPHCDPTVNLYDRYALCDGDRVTGFWPVTARGRSS